MTKNLLLFFFLFTTMVSKGQDSTRLLQEVIIKAYEYNRPLIEVAAPVVAISETDLQRFNNTSFLPAVNTIAGVRMEERSPGSYRLSIRGSTLRSPFGIRNVKIYWNELPFTDPGGNTYLNLLDFNSIERIEIIKGPGGSLYGAGTGGVILLNSPNAKFNRNNVRFSSVAGSYGLLRYSGAAQTSTENANTSVHYSHQQSDGYRKQTKMVRDVVQADGTFRIDEKRIVSGTLLYTDLFYQIPGGINKAQFDENPKQARQPAGPNPGAVQQKTAIYNKTFFGGISHEYQWNDHWSNRTGVYGSFTRFENPFITNYEKRVEQSLGGRTNTQWDFGKGKLNFGAELQHGFSPINVYDNNGGVTGDLQNSDELISTSSFVFSQVEFLLPNDFFVTAGASLNFYSIKYQRVSDNPPFSKSKDFDPVVSPRVALLKKLNEDLSVYGGVSRGFSPPTVAELYPSTATFNNDLNPEKGTNVEIGSRGSVFESALSFDLNLYLFNLDETIVIRRNADDEDYFINAGKTRQKGLEVNVAWKIIRNTNAPFSDLSISATYTRNDYTFRKYVKGSDDYSGNALTGVPENVLVSTLDMLTRFGVYANVTFTFTDEIPLNDANTVYADSYSLLGARVGYRRTKGKIPFNLFAGVDNALDERYSLGNDLNAFGNRYFNAAAPRNFYGGVTFDIVTKATRQ